ncbi:MAG: hypothetical protein WAU32_09375 [Thermoanaerobaculia bacterium]
MGNKHVRFAVILARVLLLTALSRRFQIQGARIGRLLTLACVTLAIA